MVIKLGILDQSPLFEGENASDAFAHTLEIARLAERLGYERLWVSEHHDSAQVAGSSPEVLIAYLLAKTEKIRIGSGGVMLQHYSPYKVAENFNVLAALAPGRVELGVGRAPGGLPNSTKALQKGVAEPTPLEGKLAELEQYLHDRLPEDHPLPGLKAYPAVDRPAELYVLGTSVASAELAAQTGHPYVFALFINGDIEVAEAAFAAYRAKFDGGKGTVPRPMLALSVIVAETDGEAASLAEEIKIVKIRLESGRTITVGTVEHAEEFGRQTNERFTIEVREADVTKGSPSAVRARLLELSERLGAEELIVTTGIKDFARRKRSFELLKEAFAELPAGREERR
ncbi:LLM class flavin-dependent oxidoreductase [Cohnella massiliensis]|uniref:LLM class flavin-dependent oxidoreductase n=1 Tax=Cohnella massiliensis TaxID=1816691 RepID=UPI0009B96064|nr:LLM class flavin-dependent oxidoreductase [Cohnella massiliensis]